MLQFHLYDAINFVKLSKGNHRMVPQPEEKVQKHPLPLWVRWFMVLLILVVIVAGTILWIIQGTHAIIPIAVFDAVANVV